MTTISGIILRLLGWKIIGRFPDLQKSVVIIAPHTSNWDIVLGKLYMNEMGVVNKVLVKKELFFFPMNIIMYFLGTLPVDRNDRKNNVIYQAADYFKKNDQFNIVVSAEGTRTKVSNWKKGFYYIAQKANVPIVVSYIDYKKKELGVKTTLDQNENIKEIMRKINALYKGVNPKFPKMFSLDKRYL